MTIDLHALKNTIVTFRTAHHPVLIGSLKTSHKVSDDVLAKATQARDDLNSWVETGATEAKNAANLVDLGVDQLTNLRQTRGLRDDPTVLRMIGDAEATWKAASDVLDNLYVSLGGKLDDIPTPRRPITV